MTGGSGHVDRWLNEWLDGTLSEARHRAVERHLAACPRCRARADGLRGVVQGLRALAPAEPPPGFAARVRQRIEALGAGAGAAGDPEAEAVPASFPVGLPVGTRLAAWLRRGGWRPAVAAAAVLVFLVWAAGQWLGGAAGSMAVGGSGGVTSPVAGSGAGAGPEERASGAGEQVVDSMAAANPASGAGATSGAGLASDAGRTGGAQPPGGAETASELQAQDPAGRMLIRTGRLEMTVPDVEAAYRAAEAVARRHGGFVQNARVDRNGSMQAARLTLRVPDDRLETAMDELAGLAPGARVDARSIDAQDISREYVDARARVENLRAQEARLRELASRAGDVEELLRVEQELWRVRGEIEQWEGQIRFWDQAVRLATVEVFLKGAGTVPPESPGTVWERARQAFVRSMLRLGSLAQGTVVLLAALLPYAALVGLGGGVWLWWRRRGAAG